MKPTPFLIVANWKMQLSFENVIQLSTNYRNHFTTHSIPPHLAITLCPSFPALYPIKKLLEDTAIALGAQDCSKYKNGAYTGQVSAQSLAQIGCSYCIVGHSEQRLYCHESPQDNAEKIKRLVEQNIQPIICIGEKKEEYEKNKTVDALEEQLKPVIETLQHLEIMPESICIAYEPVWAIGTGKFPDQEYLKTIFDWLDKIRKNKLSYYTVNFLYGGSVQEQTIAKIKEIPLINGLLVGNASTDFQKFTNLISLL